jgi:hypothetical protein
MIGLFSSWFLLLRGAEYLAGRMNSRVLALCFIAFVGCAAWYDVIRQDVYEVRTRQVYLRPSAVYRIERAAVAVLVVGALAGWQLRESTLVQRIVKKRGEVPGR